MHSQIDLDPTHGVIRVTVLEETVTPECAEDVYWHLSMLASRGGHYAAIYDLSMAKSTTIPAPMVRSYARRKPPIPKGRPHVVVGQFPVIYGLARLFQMCGESNGKEFKVVHSLEEAYKLIEVRPEDFTERIFPARMAA